MSKRLAKARKEGGYIAVIAVILCPIVFGVCAFTVDVGNWYFIAQNEQRAADAAALAGVTYMPSNFTQAKATALAVASTNGYSTGVDVQPVDGQPSKLRVTITQTVDNTFGKILGVDSETVVRTSVANYQAPLPMGSPCNGFGNGPEPTIGAGNPRSSNCAAAGQFWANVGSPLAPKSNGDAYQDNNCGASATGTDGCSSGNTDYSNAGYFYSVKLSAPVNNLTIQAFDPAFISVGDLCSVNFGSGSTAAVTAKNAYNYNVGTSATTASYKQDKTLYASGQTNQYCTGDQLFTQNNVPPDTTYTIRQAVSTSNPWDPTSYPAIGSCTKTFAGFSGDLYTALNQYTQTYTSDANGTVTYKSGAPVLAKTGTGGYQDQIASEFRQWVTLCNFSGTVPAGTYFIQVQGSTNSQGDGHNRFALRAFSSSDSSQNSSISISGYTNMAIYANLTSAQTSFYLTQVTPAAAGQVLNVRLFDIGDSTTPGTVTIKPPADSNLSSFNNCTGTGPTSGALANCSITASSAYNGKWETISIPIPSGFTCDSSSVTGCWITLSYNYGLGQPSDTTSWTASLDGTPVRITE